MGAHHSDPDRIDRLVEGALDEAVTNLKRRRSIALAVVIFLAIQVERFIVMGLGLLGKG